jgi:hypothetical protein
VITNQEILDRLELNYNEISENTNELLSQSVMAKVGLDKISDQIGSYISSVDENFAKQEQNFSELFLCYFYVIFMFLCFLCLYYFYV